MLFGGSFFSPIGVLCSGFLAASAGVAKLTGPVVSSRTNRRTATAIRLDAAGPVQERVVKGSGGGVQQRLRDLPSRVGVYLVLAMVVFPEVGLAGVWTRLTGGCRGCRVCRWPRRPRALRDLRRRVGPAPIKALFEHLAGPTSSPGMPGCRIGLRMVAVDGCSSLKAPDTARNRAVFRIGRRRSGNDGWPGVQLLALAEAAPGCCWPRR